MEGRFSLGLIYKEEKGESERNLIDKDPEIGNNLTMGEGVRGREKEHLKRRRRNPRSYLTLQRTNLGKAPRKISVCFLAMVMRKRYWELTTPCPVSPR